MKKIYSTSLVKFSQPKALPVNLLQQIFLNYVNIRAQSTAHSKLLPEKQLGTYGIEPRDLSLR